MASNLVLLTFRPGIQRDGVAFQGDYCTDGQWVRFQRGKPKKIGGMKAASDATINNKIATDMLLLPYNNQIYSYIAHTTGIISSVITTGFDFATNQGNLLNGYNNPNVKWQIETVIRNNQKTVVFLATNNALNIADNTAPRLFYGIALTPNTQLTEVLNINPLLNGGMCYAAPYLFLYGSNGFVQYSANNDPLNFIINAENPASGGSIPISKDKVIWGRPIRGGTNSPAVLFWTLSSVVRITNAGEKTVDFKIDVISNSSSILSSKCVVEYDGLFFWPGTDRFFIYNGIVQEMVNNTNLNYFFDNIDMNFRQKVFGVKNPKYGEIWWYYPEKEETPGRNAALPAGTNTRALIYNKRENSWYDTAIYRDCGVFSDDLGILATYGMSLTNPVVGTTNIWRHEFSINESVQNGFNNAINSSFTTPIFAWASFNPVYSANSPSRGQPTDRWTELKRIEPNFILANADNMTVTVNTQTYAASPIVSSAAITFNGTTEKIDMRNQGRQMSLTFSSGSNFEMGNILMLLGIGDGQ